MIDWQKPAFMQTTLYITAIEKTTREAFYLEDLCQERMYTMIGAACMHTCRSTVQFHVFNLKLKSTDGGPAQVQVTLTKAY